MTKQKNDVKEHIDLIVSILGLLAIVYRIAKAEAKIYEAIDKLKDELVKDLTEDKHKLALHLVEWQEKKEHYAYRLGGLEQLIQHKFNRLNGYIKQIAGFLKKKDDFIIREDEW